MGRMGREGREGEDMGRIGTEVGEEGGRGRDECVEGKVRRDEGGIKGLLEAKEWWRKEWVKGRERERETG